jgi:hypothetical protein
MVCWVTVTPDRSTAVFAVVEHEQEFLSVESPG